MTRFYEADSPFTHAAPARYAARTAPGPDPRGALLPGVEDAVATQYRVKYKILPAGVGPDDYESADLDGGEILLHLSDPEPAGFAGDQLISVGPPYPEVEKALAAHLPDGATPIILRVDKV